MKIRFAEKHIHIKKSSNLLPLPKLQYITPTTITETFSIDTQPFLQEAKTFSGASQEVESTQTVSADSSSGLFQCCLTRASHQAFRQWGFD